MAASKLYLKGDRVELLAMEDPQAVPVGTQGTVEHAEDVDFGGGDRFTQISVAWDNGRTLMACVPPDRVRKLGGRR